MIALAAGFLVLPGRLVAQPCQQSRNALCLADGRYEVVVDWRNQYSGATGRGIMIPRSAHTGFAAFDNQDNIELIFKVLNFDGVVKVFYGQLTDLEFTLRMRDTLTGRSEAYSNTTGDCGAIDQDAFKSLDGRAIATPQLRRLLNRRIKRNNFPAGTCVASPGRLCLLNKRFQVEVSWRNQYNGQAGNGHAQPLTNLSGIFDYGDPSNVELMVKALDFGGGRILFLYGALSDLEYTINLKDTLTGFSKRYQNAAGRYCGGIDGDVLGGGGGGTAELAGTWEGNTTSVAARGTCVADPFRPITVSGRWVYTETGPGTYRVRQTIPIGNIFTCDFTATQDGAVVRVAPVVTPGVPICTDSTTVCPGGRRVRLVVDLDRTHVEGIPIGSTMRLEGTSYQRVTDAQTGEFLGTFEVDTVQELRRRQ